jgi:hypothetical protein
MEVERLPELITPQRKENDMETMAKRTEKRVLVLALTILNFYRKEFELYEEVKREAYKEGYRPHYCIHGTNLWTDYDPMCGPCEDGYGYYHFDTYARLSLDEAKSAIAEQDERTQKLVALMLDKAPIEITEDLSAWVKQPVTRWTERQHHD